MNINYTRIRNFLVTVKHMNMNSAARELFITQPALSLSISKLEEELGLVLFYRKKNRLILSREGKLLLPRLEKIRNEVENLISEVEALKLDTDKHVNISFSGSAYVFSELYYNGVIEKLPSISAKLSFVDFQQALYLLLSEQTDLAITYPAISHPRVTSEILYTEPIGVVLPNCHPMSGKEILELTDLPELLFHGLNKNHLFRYQVDKILAKNDIYPNYTTQNSYPEYIRKMAESDGFHCFFSTLNNYNVNFSAVGGYVYRPVNEPTFLRSVGISYLTTSNIQYQYPELLSNLKAIVPSLYDTINHSNHTHLMNLISQKP